MRLSAPRKRHKMGRIHCAATHLPLEDVPPMGRVLHGAVLRWLFFSRNGKCIFPGLFFFFFPQKSRAKKREGILLGCESPGCKYIPVSLTVFHIFHATDSTIPSSRGIRHHHTTHSCFSHLQHRHAALQSSAHLTPPLTPATWVHHRALKPLFLPLPPSHRHTTLNLTQTPSFKRHKSTGHFA